MHPWATTLPFFTPEMVVRGNNIFMFTTGDKLAFGDYNGVWLSIFL